MTKAEFQAGCAGFRIQPPDGFYEKHKSIFASWESNRGLFWFMEEFFEFEADTHNDTGLTICSLIRYLRGTTKRLSPYWWGTMLAEDMAKKMNAKLIEYKEEISRVSAAIHSDRDHRLL